jgi:hypothetical protein
MLRWLILATTHLAALAAGFALGIYALPILTAPPTPDAAALQTASQGAMFKTRFARDLKGSDFLHWGEGEVRIAADRIAFEGKLAPGPDYKLYLTKDYVDTRAGFLAIKPQAVRVGDVKTFNGFIVDVPAGVDVNAYTTVVVWCEAFNMFISSGKYR